VIDRIYLLKFNYNYDADGGEVLSWKEIYLHRLEYLSKLTPDWTLDGRSLSDPYNETYNSIRYASNICTHCAWGFLFTPWRFERYGILT
jgi:hypothetical protein